MNFLKEIQMEKYLHMNLLYEKLNMVTVCWSQHKRLLIKRTNKGC